LVPRPTFQRRLPPERSDAEFLWCECTFPKWQSRKEDQRPL